MNTTLIEMVINTLNTIEVRGKENMGALLGSIEALETFVQMAKQPAEKQEVIDG